MKGREREIFKKQKLSEYRNRQNKTLITSIKIQFEAFKVCESTNKYK